MPERHSERVGLVLVRVWVEESAPKQLKARLMFTSDLTGGTRAQPTEAKSASIDDICDTIRYWLEEFATT